MEAFQWLIEHGCPVEVNRVALHAIERGHLDIFKWIISEFPCDLNSLAISAAGNLDFLKFLNSGKNIPMTSEIFESLARNYAIETHREIYEWLTEIGCPLTENVFNFSVLHERSFLHLQWLIDHWCPWSTETCANAALVGNLEGLKFLRKNGCPWDSKTAKYATLHDAEFFEWVKNEGCEIPEDLEWVEEVEND